MQNEDLFRQIVLRAKQDTIFRERLRRSPKEALQEYHLPDELIGYFILPNFSWLIEGKLAGSSRPNNAEAFSILKDAGVTTLVSLTENPLEPDFLSNAGFTAFHSPIPDLTAPAVEQVEQILAQIKTQLDNGEVVAVHCAAGIGRTGTILACYLVSEGLSAGEAITTIRNKRPGSIETLEQEKVVVEFAHRLQNSN
jgi:atypical dual specificity phosphatase